MNHLSNSLILLSTECRARGIEGKLGAAARLGVAEYDMRMATGPVSAIWGIPNEQVHFWIFGLLGTGELLFVIGLFILGGEWWGRFRELLKWHDPEALAEA